MDTDRMEQRREGARMIIQRCKEFASELGVDMKDVRWKEGVEEEKNAYTLIVHVESKPDEIQLADTELEVYPTGMNTKGTDAKLRSIIKKRY